MMRTVTSIAAALGTTLMLTPALAVELRECGSIKDPHSRMECLERNTVALNTALEAVTRELGAAVKALEGKIARTQTALGKLDSVNITSNAAEHRCIHDDRNGGLNLDSCSNSPGWKLVPR
jgi:hypothetical protein